MNSPIIDEPNQFVSSSKSVGGTIRGAYQSVNPFDGKILKTFDQLTDKQLETALATAAICFEAWRRTTYAERAVVAAKAAAIMRARVDDYAATAGAWRRQARATSGKQPGDPVRAAHAIVKAIESPSPPHHRLLGNDAYKGATAKLEDLRKQFSAWEAVSRGADCPKEGRL